MAKLLLLNKPYGILSQFRDQENRDTLSQFIDIADVYPAGRLDKDSEGLLLLTNSGPLQHQISHPNHKQPKYYWVQVEGEPCEAAQQRLRQGVTLKDGPTRPAKVTHIDTPDGLWPRNPPIRQRQNIPTHWLEIVISEGRNRQVRRMTAAVDLPTLRLIRHRIGDWQLADLAPGEWRELSVNAPQPKATNPGRRSPHNHKQRRSHPSRRR